MLQLPGCRRVATVADHRANRGHGGSKILNNPMALVAACGQCNGDKENATGSILADLITRGLRVLKSSTNEKTLRVCELTPVTYPDGQFWIHADGTRERVDRTHPRQARKEDQW